MVCIGAIFYFVIIKGGDKKGETGEVAAIEASEPVQTPGMVAQPQAMIPMQMQQPVMMAQPQMMQPGMMVQQPGMMQPGMMMQ